MTSEDIKSIRKALGMSQAAFAVAAGTGRETVNRWENGKQRPSLMAERNLKQVAALVEQWP